MRQELRNWHRSVFYSDRLEAKALAKACGRAALRRADKAARMTSWRNKI